MKKLSDLGERKAIHLISKIFLQKEVAVGIGDDCAAIDFGEKYLLVSINIYTFGYSFSVPTNIIITI